MKLAAFCLSFLAATTAQAEMYKWVGADGSINYTDTPPPPTIKNVQTKSLNQGSINTSDLPFELANVTQKHPVTLFTTSKCRPCNDARAFLNARGIPFLEKTVNTAEDQQKFKQSGGSDSMPFLLVGSTRQQGFDPSAWGSTLTAAGYPETSKLPKGYQNPAAAPAAPVTPKSEKSAENAAPQNAPAPNRPRTTPTPPPPNAAPPGFRF